MKTSVLSSSNRNADSPKSTFAVKRRRLLGPTPTQKTQRPIFNLEYENLSQSEVRWGDCTDSPTRNVRERDRSSILLQTPVRVMKKAVSSPLLSAKDIKARTESLFQFELELNSIGETKSEGKVSSFDLSSQDFKFDLDDDEILAAVEEIEAESQAQQVEKLKEETKTKYFDDSFDDLILSSIPIEVLTGTTSTKPQQIELVFDPVRRTSQIVPEKKSLPRFPSDPVKSPRKAPSQKRTAATFERHNSLPTSSSSAYNGTSTMPVQPRPSAEAKRCTPSEIAEKKRQAMERLKKTKANKRN